MITKDIIDILRILVDKPIDQMTDQEVRQRYEGLLNVIIGIIIGSKLSTDQVNELLKKKK